MPFSLSRPFPGTARTILSLLPVAVPTVYVLVLKLWVSRHVQTARTGARGLEPAPPEKQPTAPPPDQHPASIPAQVVRPDSDFVLACERVASRPVAVSELAYPPSPELLTVYVRAAMESFSWTPQAFLIRALIKDAETKRTFDSDYIHALDFADGDLVDGVYRVVYRGNGLLAGSERVELILRPPESYRGPSAEGLIVVGMERAATPDGAEAVVFTNETWLWRRRDEPLLILERALGRWFHELLAGWLIVKGLESVTIGKRR